MGGTGKTASMLLLGVNYAPEPVGIGPYTTGLAQALVAAGHGVTMIAGEPYYPEWRRHDGAPRGWSSGVEQGVRITRCPHYIPARPSGLKRIAHLASFALSSLVPALRAARREKPGVVLVVAPALLSVPVGWLAARVAGAKLWIHIQDFEVEAAFATGLVSGAGKAARLALGLEKVLLGLADRISTISPQMCAKLREKGVAAERIVEARNWANADFARPDGDGAAYRAQWGLGTRAVALYSGNIANKQGIDIIVEAARKLQHRRDLVFIICGAGPNRENLARLAQGLDNIQLHDLQPAERMADMLALASIHLLPQLPGAADLVLPSKLANMLGSGRPVVATAARGTGLAAEVEGAGLVTEPGDVDAFAAGIEHLLDHPDEAAAYGAEGRARAVSRWSKAALLDHFVARIGEAASHG